MHDEGICHRDINPQNILLDKDYNVKISDFGLATNIIDDDGEYESTGKSGTPGFMAPEQIKRKPNKGHEIDMFALGITFFLIHYNQLPLKPTAENDDYLCVSGK